MSRLVAVDTGPLGMISNPSGLDEAARCKRWARDLIAARVRVIIPEVADYEIRRELIRKGSTSGLARLDRLKIGFEYIPITPEAMNRAAELWAEVRRLGKPTASSDSRDCDFILAARALTSAEPGDEVIVATANVAHLERFNGIATMRWDEILP